MRIHAPLDSRLRECKTGDFRLIISPKFPAPGPHANEAIKSTTTHEQMRRCTVFNLRFEEIDAGRCVLLGIVPTRPLILDDVADPVACKACQPRFEASSAPVVEDRCRVDAAWTRRLQRCGFDSNECSWES